MKDGTRAVESDKSVARFQAEVVLADALQVHDARLQLLSHRMHVAQAPARTGKPVMGSVKLDRRPK